ncbi:MAG: amidase domain-containing protein [Clostridia bacterium]|nr:amidase domain-containing protein [Clostridia bacterium]
MPEIREYDRARAVAYARRWALSRNPLFFDFTGGGGNCTNFVSQCILAGCCQMNFTPDFGWYYISPDERAAAWTGVEFFYNFITNNAESAGVGDGLGPFGSEVRGRILSLGDVIQLGREDGDYYHTLIVTGYGRRTYLVSAHSDDAYNRPLSSYNYSRIRYIHIDGYRTDERYVGACFDDLITGTALGI